MKNNKISKPSPLEELRQRKLILKQECLQDEERFFKAVDGFKSSWKGILLNSIFSSPKSMALSLFSSSRNKKAQTNDTSGSLFQKLLPMLWTVLQPILMKMVMNKIKDLFARTNK